MLRQAARLLLPKSSLGYTMPDDAWFRYVRNSTVNTPDIAKLEQYSHQLFFSCDETQAGHTQHSYLEGAEAIFPAFTQQFFNYWDSDNPVLPPVPMKTAGWKNPLPGYPPVARIKGHIYKISIPELVKLDIYKENTVQFYRERVRLVVPYRALRWVHDRDAEKEQFDFIAPNSLGLTKERVAILRAWMYIGRPEYWDKLISTYDFHSVPTHTSNQRKWLEEYYRLQKPPR